MINKPTQPYSGLCVIISWPSRFDTGGQLITGFSGEFFNNCLLADIKHLVHRANIEIRTADELGPLPVNTKCLLLLGQKSLDLYRDGFTLNEQRGSPFLNRDGIPCIASYQPQDAHDRKAFFVDDDTDTDEGEDTDEGKTTHGKTQRKNWRFWLRQDIRKAVRITREGLTKYAEPIYHFWPTASDVIRELTVNKNKELFFDIENDSQLQLTCFGFSFGDGHVWIVPMLQTHLSPRRYHYDEIETCKILQALVVAMRDSRCVVIHNSMWDLFVLIYRYGLPIVCSVYDSMLSHNRCYIEVEKSLGHGISLYTDLPYHKNEGVFEPKTLSETQSLYEYNGKDVYSMTLLKPAIEQTAIRLGAVESIELANREVQPYLLMQLKGMNVDNERANNLITKNKRMQIQLTRIASLLSGRPDFNCNSPMQVGDYLYGKPSEKMPNAINLKKPEKDATNEKTLLQILLHNDAGMIHVVIKYRGLSKQSSKVNFKRYKPLFSDYYKPEVIGDRFTCAYNLAGTTTMRKSSRKLLSRKKSKSWEVLTNIGDNAQNFEKQLRKVIISDKGKIFVQIDEKGADALIVAYSCRAAKFRDLFIYGVKPHTFVALHLFKEVWAGMPTIDNKDLIQALVSEIKNLKHLPGWKNIAEIIAASDNWTDKPRYYYIAKQTCHSSNYDIKARTYRINILLKSDGTVALTHQECVSNIEGYRGLFNEIPDWHNETVIELRRTSILRNMFGHPRVFTSFIEPSMYKEAYAFGPQSTVAQIISYAAVEIQEGLDSGKYPSDLDLLQDNHDSLLTQCFPHNRDLVGKILQQHVNRKMTNSRGEVFHMQSELGWSDKSWGDIVPFSV